jgi:hypothetical protein
LGTNVLKSALESALFKQGGGIQPFFNKDTKKENAEF